MPPLTPRKGDGGDWLVSDNDTEHVQTSFQIEGDTYHLGLALKVTVDPEDPVPLPDVVKLLHECARAVQDILDGYPGPD